MKLLVSHSPLVTSLVCLSAAACRMYLVNNWLPPPEAPRPARTALSDRFFYFSWVRVGEAAAEDLVSASLKTALVPRWPPKMHALLKLALAMSSLLPCTNQPSEQQQLMHGSREKPRGEEENTLSLRPGWCLELRNLRRDG